MLTDNLRPVSAQLLIDGEWIGGNRLSEIRNPANPDEVVGTAVQAGREHVDLAVAAARSSQRRWEALGFVARAKAIAQGLERLETGTQDRSELYSRENGRVLAEALAELRASSINQRITLEYADVLAEGREIPAHNGVSYVDYMAYGVVASIIPWNAPVTLSFLQIVPALLAGNTMVVKPPESCSLALVDALGAFSSALPRGVINVVTGRASEIGEHLTAHPGVDKVAFIGGIGAGSRVMANAARTVKSVALELGGNDPAILLPDMSLESAALRRMAHSVFSATGQVCMAIKRIYVPDAIADRFVDAFSRVVDEYVVGPGLDKGVTMGPMHTRQSRDGAQAIADDAEGRGATVRWLGQISDQTAFSRGYFIRPAVVTGVTDDAPLMKDEQFCPVIPIATYSDLEDAVERANTTSFGLGASVWSANPDKALQVARRLEAGTVFVNSHGVSGVNRRAPYGGMKQSGIGRKAGLEGILEYLQSRTITKYDLP